MRNRFERRWEVVLACLVAAACRSDSPLTQPVASHQPRLQVARALVLAEGKPVQTINEGLVRFSELVPGGFGGMYYDGAKLVVWLKDPSAQGAARSAILAQRREAPGRPTLSASDIEFRRADYDWSELYDWYDRLSSVWGAGAVVATDMDEATNRIEIFVESAAAITAVRAHLRSLGIPDKAVTVRVRDRVRFASTLSSKERPAIGGYKIRTTPSGKICTMGLAGKAGADRVLLTNSHCTTTFMNADPSDKVYQPTNASGNLIGLELEDPTGFTNATHPQCPVNHTCRYSDAALFEFDTPGDALVGAIERTTGLGSTTVHSDTTKRWRILDDDPNCGWVPEFICDYVDGTELNFVGHVSGWKDGTVTDSCQNEGTEEPNTTLICQDWFGATAKEGDSGAAVFEITWDDGGSHPEVTVYGIVWGFVGSETVFSRIKYIRQELVTSFGIKAPPILQ